MDLSFVTRHNRLFLVISLLVTIIFGSFAPFVKTVNNVDYFTLQDHPDQKFYEQFKEVFGNDEFFIIAFAKKDIFLPKNLNLIKEVTGKLEDSELVREVISLASVDNITGRQDYFEVSPFLDEIPESRAELAELKQEALNNPLYARNLISPDARTTAIVVFAHDHPDDSDYRQELLARTHSILEPYKDSTEFHLAGWTVTNYKLSQYMQKDLARFIPLTYLLIGLVTFFFFRNLRLTLLAMITISACLASTMGLFRVLGIPINNVTTIIPPLVMALSLADIVHIFTHMERSVLKKFPDRRKALASVLNRVAAPCFLTTVTTAIGFLSLAVSKLSPIREFAVLASAGMLFEFFFAFFLLPPLVLFFDPAKLYCQVREKQLLTRGFYKLNNLIRTYSRMIVILGILVITGSIVAAAQVQVETNLTEYFRKSSPERKALNFVEENLSGVASLDISLKADQRDAFREPANLKTIERIETFISGLSGVDLSISFNNFIKEMNKSFHNEQEKYYRIPENRRLISQYLLLYDSEDIDDYINSDYNHARIMIRLGEHSSAEQEVLIKKIRQYIDSLKAPGLTIRITGQALQDVNTIDALVSGQVKSLGFALLIISLLMFIVLKSLSIGLLSLVPNLFPILINFAIMGIFGIPLNTATSLIAAVALGIAVDDTIHFLSFYNDRRRRGEVVFQAVEETVFTKGRALVSSSVILCIGFGILMLGSFVPTANFGLLTAIIMITALIGDLVLLPAILNSLNRSTSPLFPESRGANNITATLLF